MFRIGRTPIYANHFNMVKHDLKCLKVDALGV
jgi:hypothetical protein